MSHNPNRPTHEQTRKAKHTPGPWKAKSIGTARGKIGYYLLDTDGVRIASVCHRADAPTAGEANVRLMESAPDLLAACKHAIDGGFVDSIRHPDTYHLIYAAIAKAEGGAS